MTEEEHKARALLMGLRYHHGNGDPFYYEADEDGIPIVSSMIDANTQEKIVQPAFKGDPVWADVHVRKVTKRVGMKEAMRWI